MRKAISHAVTVVLGLVAGFLFAASQPHPPAPEDVGFTLIQEDGCREVDDILGVKCIVTATTLYYGTDGLLHPATETP